MTSKKNSTWSHPLLPTKLKKFPRFSISRIKIGKVIMVEFGFEKIEIALVNFLKRAEEFVCGHFLDLFLHS